MFKKLVNLITITSLCFLVSCKTDNSKDPYANMTDAEMFHRAKKHFRKKKFIAASQDLEALESHYPFGEYADKAQLTNIYAYFKSDEPVAALAAAERFIQLHPRHPHVDYAYFMKGVIHYHQSLGTFNRYLPLDRDQREIQSSQLAYDDFALLIRRFPDSLYVPNAHQRMIFLRNRLANHELHIARFYMERKAYLAAANRCTAILEHYHQAPNTAETLKILKEAYEGLGLTDLANSTQQVLKLNYPTHS